MNAMFYTAYTKFCRQSAWPSSPFTFIAGNTIAPAFLLVILFTSSKSIINDGPSFYQVGKKSIPPSSVPVHQPACGRSFTYAANFSLAVASLLLDGYGMAVAATHRHFSSRRLANRVLWSVMAAAFLRNTMIK